MHTDIVPKLSLHRWAQLMGINTMHFWGVTWPDNPPSVCEQPWMQRADQEADRVGREEVALAIAQAEAAIEQQIGYRLLPAWEVNEWRPAAPVGTMPEMANRFPDGRAPVVDADWGHVISGGIRSKALITAGAVITYTDTDGDGWKETATVTVNVSSGQSPCEVRVYVPVAGGGVAGAMPWEAADDRFEIRPASVSITGLVATIRFRREQAVEPHLHDDYIPPAGDDHFRGVPGDDDANFLATVDVYRVYNDPQQQATLMWEPYGTGFCGTCNGSGCEVCAYSVQTACLMIRDDPRLGLFSYRPAVWNTITLGFDSESWGLARRPDIVRLYYYGGYQGRDLQCPTTQMDHTWERIVAQYAAALLERPICECNNVAAYVAKWQRDYALTGADERAAQVPQSALDNPLGTTVGAVAAWRHITTRGVAIGRGA